jgi:uncharacterized BrkB/YihY/UPF0761 family membrane protein
MTSSHTSVDARIYRALLRLLPAAFQRDFSDDMLRDFNDALDEAWQREPASARWLVRGRLFSDFARTFGLQWLRSGWPVAAMLAMGMTLASTAALASVWRRLVFVLPSGSVDQDVIALEMLTVVVFLFIVATVLMTMWSARLVRRGTKRRA